MTLNEYQQLAARTISSENPLIMEYHALHGMVAELGELHGIYQKAFQGHNDSEEHTVKELGDILWMLAEYATAHGWTLENIAQQNIEKLKARYPDGFDPQRSLHREEGDI